ncbi:hypothetical protein JCM8208_007183 [Rhodotorula glutinis]
MAPQDDVEPWSESDEDLWSEDEDEVDALDVKAAEKRLLMLKDFWHALNVLPMLKHAAYIHACTMEFDRLRDLHVRHEGLPSQAELEQRREVIKAEDTVVDKQRAYIGHGGADAVEADEQLALIVDLHNDLAKQARAAAEEVAELSNDHDSTALKAARRARTLLDAIARHADAVTAQGERYLEAYAIEHQQNALYHLNRHHPLLGRRLDQDARPVAYPLEHCSGEDARTELRKAFARRYHRPGTSSSRPRRDRYLSRRRRTTLHRSMSTVESSVGKAGEGGLRRDLRYFGRGY